MDSETFNGKRKEGGHMEDVDTALRQHKDNWPKSKWVTLSLGELWLYTDKKGRRQANFYPGLSGTNGKLHAWYSVIYRI